MRDDERSRKDVKNLSPKKRIGVREVPFVLTWLQIRLPLM